MNPWLLMVIAYVAGSIPFGLLIVRWVAGVDVREHGSGNIGATNVYRVAGKPAGALVLVLDLLKGLWAPLAARALGMEAGWVIAVGLSAVLGHSASPFLKFKGGKGVATGLGVLFGVMWQVGVVSAILWTSSIAITGYVSVGSILGAVVMIPACLIFYPGDHIRLLFAIIGAVLIVSRHIANIRRLMNGTESSFKHKKTTSPE